jgi:hypothetical protein
MGQAEQGRQNRKGGAGQADKTCRIGQAELDRQMGQGVRTGQSEQDRQNRTGRTGQAEQGRQTRTGYMFISKQDRHSRTCR